MDASVIIGAVQGVTKKWAKQRKAEERRASAQSRRYHAMTRGPRQTIKDAVYDHIEAAYDDVSDNGKLPAAARQMMYNVRRRIQADTDEELSDNYFTQVLLPQFMQEQELTEDWDVVFDARGHFTEPHTNHEVSLGTLDVRHYLSDQADADDTDFDPDDLYPTHGPENRFSAILFIEKEGFMPLFKKVELAKRYDIAIMSTKGLSNTAARLLVDQLCGEHNSIPLFVLHDFDKAGFSIASTLRRSTSRYEFKNRIKVIDMGLRLTDVEEWELASESFHTKASTLSMRQNLRWNGATDEEIDFIADERQRVELNAFRSADLIAFIEGKLGEHHIKKVVPSAEILEAAYRRALRIEFIKQRFGELKEEADAYVDAAKVPTLNGRIARRLKKSPATSWDRAIADMAAKAME